jgi:integrase
MLSDFIAKRKLRSAGTAESYLAGLVVWARSRNESSPDVAIQHIIESKASPYDVIQAYINYLSEKGKSPSTIRTYITALKAFMLDNDIEYSREKLRAKTVMPAAYYVSTDRAPTPQEVKRILQFAKLPTRAAILTLASSGLRIGELVSLKVQDIHFGEPGQPSRITVKAARSKSRKPRTTFTSPEATDSLRQHLGDKIKIAVTPIFPAGKDPLYRCIMRSIHNAGLEVKDGPRNELHPHSFRKYFFSNCLAAGIDRGLVENWMGHQFALDTNYLRMSDDELANEYGKAIDKLTFLTSEANGPVRDRMTQLESENRDLKTRLERLEAISVERLRLTKATSTKKRK